MKQIKKTTPIQSYSQIMKIFVLITITMFSLLMLSSCKTKSTAPDSEALATPVISPEGGAYNEVIDVLISCATPGTTIRYTLDGSDPSSQSPQFTGLLQVNSDTMLKARAFKPGFIASAIASATYQFSTAAVATPLISPASGNYTTAPLVSITCATPGAEIRYTLDGEEPDQASSLYSAPFVVNESLTVKAKAFAAEMIPSLTASASYTMQLPLLQFTPGEGYFATAQMVSITSSVPGVTIRYTLDGTEPTEASALYSQPLNIYVNTVVKARAYKEDWLPSNTATSFYIINLADQMQLVSGGTFHNGTSNVTLSPFYIGKREVTELEWVYIMVDTLNIDPEMPETNNNWGDAIEYCNYRSIAEGYTPCYSYDTFGTIPAFWPAGWNTGAGDHNLIQCDFNANGYRLPTEMEWMFAARGGNQSQNYIYSGSNQAGEVAWYNGNTGDRVHVGTKAPNELGLYDMSGNLWEFCWDNYHNEYPSGDVTNPIGPGTGYMRVMRGGAWSVDASNCTIARRFYTPPFLGADAVGFRVVRKY